MNEDRLITLKAAEAKQLYQDYSTVAADVNDLAACLAGALWLVQHNRASLEEMVKRCEKLHDGITSKLSDFHRTLQSALQQGPEPVASPNGGPAEPSGSSGVSGGPPSVS